MDNSRDEKEVEMEENKKETPLSVRVEAYYKDLFMQLSQQPGYNRKRLLEAMISSYVKKERDENRNNNLNLEHEINLISSSLGDILKVFETISVKAQDTIGSNNGFYEQQMENLRKNTEVLELKIQALEEEKKNFILNDEDMEIRLKEALGEIDKLKSGLDKYQEELKKTKEEQGEVLSEVYSLRRIEGENIRLIAENKELLNELEGLKTSLTRQDKTIEKLNYDYEMLERRKDKEIEVLKSELENLYSIEEIKRKASEKEIEELREMIKKEMELKNQGEILELKRQYNELQIQYIKDIEKR